MTSKHKCKRCGESAETVDNVRGTTFWGLIQRTTKITFQSFIRISGTQYTRSGGPRDGFIRSDDEIRLCDPCWGLLVGRFLQGRDVAASDHAHEWRRNGKAFSGIFYDTCPLCYQTRISEIGSSDDR
ncbi:MULTISPECIES: hypothetical protein [unclassified Microbacterium]|uniref:hypothetical protein n=1 Tax=unclassified Microbacterium TaxID=2609290 RepID=UPI00386440B5